VREPEGWRASGAVPRGVRIAAAWSWRWLVIAGAAAVVIWLVMVFSLVVIPVLVAILLAALLMPLLNLMVRARFPRWLAVTLSMLALLAVMALLVVLIVTQLRSGLGDLTHRTVAAYDQFLAFLAGPPFSLSRDEVAGYISQFSEMLQRDSSVLWSGALSVGSTLGHVLTGLLLTLFSTLFFLISGPAIWAWFLRLMPRLSRPAIDGAGQAAWVSVGQYARVQVFVAFVDAVGIGVGAAILQLPLAIPIAVLVFLGSFIPFFGAIITGGFAAFIALIYGGPVAALVMLGIVILVQQVESHVLQPLVMGTAVKLHPLAVVLTVAAGSIVGGIAGALFAVPLVAALNSIVRYIAGGTWRTAPPSLGTGAGGDVEARADGQLVADGQPAAGGEAGAGGGPGAGQPAVP